MKDARRARFARSGAWDALSRAGLPNRRVESWHYTDLRAALRSVRRCRGPRRLRPRLSASRRSLPSCHRSTARSGRICPISPAAPGVSAQSLREALAKGEAEVLSALLARDARGFRCRAQRRADAGWRRSARCAGRTIAAAGACDFLCGRRRASGLYALARHRRRGRARHDRRDFRRRSRRSARRKITRWSCRSATARASNMSRTVAPQAKARCACCRCSPTLGRKRRGSTPLRCSKAAVCCAGRYSRTLAGDGRRHAFSGASLLRGRAACRHDARRRSAEPGGESRERFRHILDGQSTRRVPGQGRRAAACAKDRRRRCRSKALLLGDDATMNNKPELEIFADDVVCGHGATCGRLDADQFFYLQGARPAAARGRGAADRGLRQ